MCLCLFKATLVEGAYSSTTSLVLETAPLIYGYSGLTPAQGKLLSPGNKTSEWLTGFTLSESSSSENTSQSTDEFQCFCHDCHRGQLNESGSSVLITFVPDDFFFLPITLWPIQPKTENPCCVHSAPSPWATAEIKERLQNHCDCGSVSSFAPTVRAVTQHWRSERPPAPPRSLSDAASAFDKTN